MGKHDKKTGKGRLDKFYKLAKEQGYRARSAFKLIHLNRKYDFLATSKCAIDLCAAPGGWLQVAEKYMPKGSLIVGVDLNPIKPLPHVITFVSDITTPHCRQQLKTHLHDWKADLVMHDGAPNVGSAWVQDAFTQNELVLQSLRLATEFLTKGGNFVTKVFRSQDYNSLMWVFGQLFKSVEATKPPSSRNVSAEIFVVCQGFIAPKHIDPKFLDPKHVFKDVSSLPYSITQPPVDPSSSTAASLATGSTVHAANAVAKIVATGANHAQANVFMPEKKRRHREGYAEGDYTNFHVGSASEFIKGQDPVTFLGTRNQIEFDKSNDEEHSWLKSRHTTPEVIANCSDLKVLGKGDFKLLMKWRLAIRLEQGLDVKADGADEITEEINVEPIDEEELISEELKKLHETKMIRQKREKKRSNEKKARDLLKLQLNMTAPEDLDIDDKALGGEEVFDLGEGEQEIRRRGGKSNLGDLLDNQEDINPSDEDVEELSDGDDSDGEVLDSDEEREMKLGALEGELDHLYDEYKEHMNERDTKWKVKQARMKDKNYDAWHGIQDGNGDGSGSEDDNDEDGVAKGYKNGMIRVPRRGDAAEEESDQESVEGGWEVRAVAKAKLGEEVDSSDDDEDEHQAKKSKSSKVAKQENIRKLPVPEMSSRPKSRGLVTSLQDAEQRASMSRQAQLWFDQGVFKGIGDLAALDGDEEEENDDEDDEEESEEGSDEDMDADTEEDEDEEIDEDGDVDMELGSGSSRTLDGEIIDDDDFEIVPREADDNGPEWDVDDEDQDEVKRKIIQDKGLLTAEAVTLASKLVNRQITASQLMDEGFNRLSTFHKDGLPTWFLDDESKHYKPNIPVTKEAINVLREKQRALDARPIKKVAEAKARKKFKAFKKLEAAKKKADGVMDAEDLNMSEKARAVGKVMNRARGGMEKRPEKKVVVARGANKGVKGRPKGVKGKYKIVDSRMKKEVRALKRVKRADKTRR